MQRPLHTMSVRKCDVRVPSARVYEYAHHLSEALNDGADLGLEGIGRKTRERDRRQGGVFLGGGGGGGGGDLLARRLRDGRNGE